MITTTIFLSILGQKRAVFLDVPPEQRHFAPEEKFVVAKWYIWQKCNYDSIHRHLKYFNQCIFYCYKLSNWTFWAEEFFFFFIKSCHQLNLKDSKASDHLHIYATIVVHEIILCFKIIIIFRYLQKH